MLNIVLNSALKQECGFEEIQTRPCATYPFLQKIPNPHRAPNLRRRDISQGRAKRETTVVYSV